mmetsp:Transcript_47863/g.154138  ORF Transcript_47863/g.154138 Transcript_47863/m.154138 type:complete len:297 (+) Transcript_47863:156-1046(+)
MAPASLLLVPDLPASAPLPPLRSYLAGVWRLLCSRFFFSLIAYGLASTTLGSVASPAGIGVMRHWCEVQNLPRQMFGLAGRGIFAVGLALTRAYLINANWRTSIAATTLATIVIDVPFTACAVFDIIRSQYFLLGEEFLVEIPAAVQFLMTTFVVVEAADEENVGLVYGLLTSASNLGGSLSPLLSNQLFGRFEPSLSDSANFIEDAPSFRALVFSSFVLGYVFSLLSLCALPLLPAQKADAQARKRAWSSSTAVGWLSAGCFGAAFCYGLTLSVLTLFPRTACLELVGGSGCVHD